MDTLELKAHQPAVTVLRGTRAFSEGGMYGKGQVEVMMRGGLALFYLRMDRARAEFTVSKDEAAAIIVKLREIYPTLPAD